MAEEIISYGIPTYNYKGALVHFKAGKNHCSFITVDKSVLETVKSELKGYNISGTTIHFSAENPLPENLVRKIVEARIEQNEKKNIVKSVKSSLKRPRYQMPEFIHEALVKNQLMKAYHARPPYQQNDYIGWIDRVMQDATRQKRLIQMLEELRQGDVYMKMAYKPKVK